MNFQQFSNNPLQLFISFHKLIEELERTAENETGHAAETAKAILKEIEPYPELRQGINDAAYIENHLTVINHLLSVLFPPALTRNEIKAVTIPFLDIIFNYSERFKKILEGAGPGFDLSIRDFGEHQFYVMTCCLILNEFYNTNLDFGKPLFYDIPTRDGIIKHFRILYNADFMEIIPTDKAKNLTRDDIDLLLNNYDDLDLWKEKFPEQSYIMKGFAIVNLFDATVENAVSALKGTLLSNSQHTGLQDEFESIFRSIFRIPDLRIGFTSFDSQAKKFTLPSFSQPVRSFILDTRAESFSCDELSPKSHETIIDKEEYFAAADCSRLLADHPESSLLRHFVSQGIQSFILAPIVKDDVLLGVLELVSSRPGELNSVNAHKLEVVMPFLIDTIDRQMIARQNQIQAIIQDEYTAIHPSVHWKFRQEAIKLIDSQNSHTEYNLKEIVFDNVYPLYGQIDIKGSSESRNMSIQKDMNDQLDALMQILEPLAHVHKVDDEVEKLTELKSLIAQFSSPVKTDIEQHIQHYIDTKIHPLLNKLAALEPACEPAIADYFKQLDKVTGSFFTYRRKYDTTVSAINQKMAALLDSRQADAQQMFPHYYERFKTDGVEHNLYIGASINPSKPFDLAYLHNLRLWQLQVLCEMERKHHTIKPLLPYPLEVTTLILAFGSPISIRFRMDEKRFDVDGTYNARFEIVKKRIDKAHIKGTTERIAETGKITIVYTGEAEENEYREHIHALQRLNLVHNEVETLEVEDLQSISGLRALRVRILHND
jgi:hypothetical protein